MGEMMNRYLLLAASPLALISAGAFAQDADDDMTVEIITVTTQKREESAYEVPITLTAYTQDNLDLLDIKAMDDLSDFVPGVNIQLVSAADPSFVIRGITSDNGNFQDPPRVSIYLNGIDVSRSRGAAFELYDLERVEVAKGPQSTLYGTAASIGAISFITARPEEEAGGEYYFGVGNEGYNIAGGHVNLGGERFLSRFAFQVRQMDGYVRNIAGEPGSNAFSEQDDLNGIDTFAIRPSFRWHATPDLTFDLVYNYESNNAPGTAFKSAVIAPTGGDTSPFTYAELGGPYGNNLLSFNGLGAGGPQLGLAGSTDIYDHLGGTKLGLEREVHDLNLTSTWDLSEAYTFTGIFGYREFDSLELFDVDGSQVPFIEFAEDTEGDQFSAELRLAYNNDGRFRGFAGVNYFHEEGYQRLPLVIDETIFGACASLTATGIQVAPTCVNPDGSFNRVNIDPATAALAPIIPATAGPGILYEAETTSTGEHSTWSFFADGTYNLTDNLEVTAGVRWVREDRTSGLSTSIPDSFLILAGSLANPFSPPIFSPLLPGFANTNNQLVVASDEFDDILPRFNVLWRMNDNINFYGTISKGRRSPVVSITQTDSEPENPLVPNDINLPIAELTPEEIVWNYEAGFKSRLFGGRGELNAAIFQQDYTDFRVQVIDLSAGGVNNLSTGVAQNFGVEVDGQFIVAPGITFIGNYAYIDAQIEDDPANNGIFAGNRFRLQPEHSGAFTADFRRDLNDRYEGFFTASYTYRSEVFFTASNAPVAGIPISDDEAGLFNLRFGLIKDDGAYELTGFVRNLTDEEYLIDGGNIGVEFGAPTFIPGPPRLWGLELRGRF